MKTLKAKLEALGAKLEFKLEALGAKLKHAGKKWRLWKLNSRLWE